MPVLRNAKKKLRQDKKRTIENRKVKNAVRTVIKKAKKDKTPETLSKAFSSVDKAVKKNILHKNKAAHVKSSLAKIVSGLIKPTVVAKAKKTSKKKSK
jgi:small subunit ribosomal protein S20